MNRSPSIRSSRAGGFTLVELLLAITLMSILLALTYTGLRAATRSAERGEKILATGGEIRAAHQFVRRQLNQMLPLPFAVTDGRDEVRIVFEGDATHIQYVAPMPGYLGAGGPQVQLLEIVRDNDGGFLQFSNSLLQGFTQERLYDRAPVVLLKNVDSAGFEFLGRDAGGEIIGWVSSWDQQDVLPVAVRLKVDFSTGSTLRWPDLVAAVRIDESAVRGGVASRSTYQQKIQDLIKGKDKSRRR